MQASALAVRMSGIATKASRVMEFLGAAGCAAFLVCAIATGIEWHSERARWLESPTLKISLPEASALSESVWALAEPTQAPTQDVIVVSQARPVSRPIRKATLAASPAEEAGGFLLGFTQNLISEKRKAWDELPLTIQNKPTQVAQVAPVRRTPKRVVTARGAIKSRETQIPPEAIESPLPEPNSNREAAVQPPAPPVAVAVVTPPMKPQSPVQAEQAPAGAMSILQGKVPAGIQIAFSFRPDRVVFRGSRGDEYPAPISADGRVMSPAATLEDTEYSMLAYSVRAGPAVVSVLNDRGSEAPSQAIAAIALEPGKTTTLDFEPAAATETRVMGQVFEAGQSEPTAIAGVEVSVVGEPSKVSITDADGAFDLGALQVIRGGRIFLEARRPDGFKHRFNLKRGEANQALYLFSEEQIAQWQRAFEGGLSPRSGWVVGALDEQAFRKGLLPEVVPQTRRTAIEPELYALGAENELEPLSGKRGSARFLAVEVPEGMATLQLRARESGGSGAVIWKRWTPISAGVINVILFGSGD